MCISFITRGKKKKVKSIADKQRRQGDCCVRAWMITHTKNKKSKSATYNRKTRCTTYLSVECVWVGDGEQQWRGETTGTGGGGRGH